MLRRSSLVALILAILAIIVQMGFAGDNPFMRGDVKNVVEEKKDLKKDEEKRESKDLSLPPPPPPLFSPSQSSLRENERGSEKVGNGKKESGNQGSKRVSLLGKVNGKVIVRCNDSIHVVENQSVICGCFVEWTQVYCSVEDYEKEKKLRELLFRGKK